MEIILKNGTIVTGDEHTVITKGSIFVKNSQIEVVTDRIVERETAQVIDVEGKVIMPGVINHHAHGIVPGPLFPTGALPLPREQVMDNLNRHLLEGTTTILCLDGFVTQEEVEAVNKIHPMNIKAGTTHTPKNLAAAKAVDGAGLKTEHKKLTAEKRVEQGAPVIGEAGAGGTLGGGLQDYKYIPEALKKKIGIEIEPRQARILKEAVLGRYIEREAFNAEKVKDFLEELKLPVVLTVEEVREVIEGCVLPPFDIALEGYEEALAIAGKHNIQAVFHNAAASKAKMLEIAKGAGLHADLIIAAHSNHPSLEPEEAVEVARRLKGMGAVIDISTFDLFVNQYAGQPPDNFYALLDAGLVDTVSTDYGGGHHDSILTGLQFAINKGVVDLPKAVALATQNVTTAISLLAPNRGLLEKGRIADIVITDKSDLSKVNMVIIGGKVVVEGGNICR